MPLAMSIAVQALCVHSRRAEEEKLCKTPLKLCLLAKPEAHLATDVPISEFEGPQQCPCQHGGAQKVAEQLAGAL